MKSTQNASKYLQQIIKKAAGQYVLDPHSSRPQRIEKKEKLADSGTDVERVEGLF